VTLQVEVAGEERVAHGQWQVAVLPAEVVVSWNDTDVFMALPVQVAPSGDLSARFSSSVYTPVNEVAPGRWILSGPATPRANSLLRLCVTAGDDGTACYAVPELTFTGAVSSHYETSHISGASGTVTVLTPYDWDQSDEITIDDVTSYMSGPPCRRLPNSSWSQRLSIAPDEHELVEPITSSRSISALIGAPVNQVDTVVSTYGSIGGTYQVISRVTDAVAALDGDSMEFSVPSRVYDFRETNPSTVHVAFDATDSGGRCYEGSALWSTVAAPSVSAIMWVDGQGYLAAGAVVAPRPGSSVYFDGVSDSFGPMDEIDEGLFQLRDGVQPDFTELYLMYFSQGQRNATNSNESLLSSFSVLSEGPLILLSSQGDEVHFPEPADYDGDSAITPADLRAYLDGLELD
jgi:hypothetical protein